MPNPHGSFIWYELMTTDTGRAGDFYAGVLGWSVADFSGNGPPYRIFSAGPDAVAGMMRIPPEAEQSGMRPGWLGYIGVDDVDAAVAAVTEAGGKTYMAPQDIAGVGRIAMITDPQGAPFYVMRGASDQTSTSFDATTAGHCSWNELTTSDPPAALGFYTGRFGWTKGDAMDMGEMGEYRFIHHAGERIGAMMRRADGGPQPAWNFYFRVDDIAAAAARATESGAAIKHGPIEVPGGDHVVIAADPQGANFSLVGKRVSEGAKH